MATGYQIMYWREFQHYKDRSPPWIKLHRTTLDNRRWRDLSPMAAKLLVDLWMVAADGDRDGHIRHDVEWIAWRLRVSSTRLQPRLDELVKAGWLRELAGNGNEALATASGGQADAEPEQSRADRADTACEKCGRLLRVTGKRLVPCNCDVRSRA